MKMARVILFTSQIDEIEPILRRGTWPQTGYK